MTVKIMDPWGDQGEISKSALIAEKPSGEHEFEDNFNPSLRDTLPDSEQYLAILEERLKRIKNDPNVLKQLSEKRQACMQNLLNGDVQYESDDDLDAPVGTSQILRTILPQKQALSKGEIVDLVAYDQLEEHSDTDTDKEHN